MDDAWIGGERIRAYTIITGHRPIITIIVVVHHPDGPPLRQLTSLAAVHTGQNSTAINVSIDSQCKCATDWKVNGLAIVCP